MRMNTRTGLPLLLASLLSACAGAPSQTPAPPPPIVMPPAITPPAPASAVQPTQAAASDSVWDRLRGSFEMAGCDADPAVLARAKRETRYPKVFERHLRAVLPRLVFVQKIAAQYEVAGEFVLLPWVESHFKSVPGSGRRPAGMWQIVPMTAGGMGLRVDRKYDGRLDIPASSHAVMKLLEQYHQRFHDWRLADYAYNAGEFAVRRIVRKHGLPEQQPVIPDWPVRKVTRGHLIKLLAIACIVREPARFKVNLPTLPADQQLVKVPLSHSMSITQAADRAGMSVQAVKKLNAAFRGKLVDTKAAPYLVLPASHARQFDQALQPSHASDDDRVTRVAERQAESSTQAGG